MERKVYLSTPKASGCSVLRRHFLKEKDTLYSVTNIEAWDFWSTARRCVRRSSTGGWRQFVNTTSNHFGFSAGKSTTDAIFNLRLMQQMYVKRKKMFYNISVDLENIFDSFIKDVLTAWNGIMSFVKTYNVSWAYLSALCLLHFTYIHEHFL